MVPELLMTRYMYDAIWANVNDLQPLNPGIFGMYLTGSADIRWQSVPAFLSRAVPVRIDQGGQTSPQYAADIFDVEPGAWSLPGAIAAVSRSTAARPGIYLSRADYAQVPASYAGVIWLAAPGITDNEAIALAAKDHRIVAVQNLWAGAYDRSVMTDAHWPQKAPVTPPPAASGLPTGIEFKAFSVQSQLNAKCDAVDGPHPVYEWQLEELQVDGWKVSQQIATTGPLVSFKDLAPGRNYRFRVSRGQWSAWVNVTAP
jgi:hypothetical protein